MSPPCKINPHHFLILSSIAHYEIEFLVSLRPVKLTSSDRIEKAKDFFGKREFSRKDYLAYYKEISAPTVSRDLIWATKEKILKKSGSRNQTIYFF